MALLMRRLFVDAQAKLRRMVEEHTANLTSRIEPECPSVADPPAASSPTPTSINPVPTTAAAAASAAVCSSPRAVPSLGARSLSLTSAQASEDSDHHRESIASSFDVKCLASFSQCKVNSSFDGGGAGGGTDDLCKNSKTDNSEKSGSVVIVDGGADMTCAEIERSGSSPGKDASNSNKTSPSRSESPKPGCSQDKSDEVHLKAELPENSRLKNVTLITTSTTSSSAAAAALRRMRLENERLQAEVTRLRRLVVSGASSKLNSHNDSSCDGDSESGPVDCSPAQVQALEAELKLAREAVTTLKADRKRLKAEKFDLLSQMKQLYATLDDKEKELREFIRNYEQRMRDSETSMQQLAAEREERERERWSLLRHARDEAERSLSLAAQLNAKELQLQQALEQLHEARRQLSSNGCLSDQESLASLPRYSSGGGGGGAATPGSGTLLPHGLGLLAGDRGSCSADSGVRVSSDRDSGGATSAGGNLSDSTTDGTPTITVDGNNVDVDSISVVSSIVPHMYHPMGSTKDCSPTLSPLNANVFSRSIDSGVLSRSVEQLSSPMDSEPTSVVSRRMKAFHSRPGSSRGGTWGSISRVFARSRHRNKVTNPSQDNETYDPYRSWSPLTEEGYAEKLRLLREASAIPMEKWRAPTVLAWIEIALGMPQYGARCAENIKSGKVLLELSDLELECGLGITHPMHRKKLRLAIEEHRHPSLVRYPCISQLGHTWVSSEWLPDLGLAQYSENFAANMVDARMLDHLSKKELEKFLGVTRKFHQASIVHGIHLLRIMKYDRQALAVRRHQSENVDADPLVWTNQRFIRWARNIDLGEYADNLKDSGVHGGLVVLEPSFNGDTMATALGIPPSKNMIRRHLMAELEALVLPARSTLEHYIRVRGAGAKHRVPGGSLGRSFSRSCGGSLAAPLPPTSASKNSSESDSRRSSLRGSLGRALGFVKSERSDKQSPTSSSESSSIISRMSTPPPLHMRESPIYAKPFAFHHSVSTSKQDEALYEDVLSDTAQSTSSAMLRKYEDRNDSSMGFHRRVKSIGEGDVVVSPV